MKILKYFNNKIRKRDKQSLAKQRLENATNENVSEFSVDGLFTLCKVVDIYDADTFRVVFFKSADYKDPMKLKVRAGGCNASEMYPLKTHEHREEEMKNARIARNRLLQLVTDVKDSEIDISNIEYGNKEIDELLNENKKLVYIEFNKQDKYGRFLGTLYLDSEKKHSVNQILIDENHAVSYDGGKRDKNKLTVNKR